ncbi:3-oxoacyl-[acyl-carrier protein] reductase [Silvimonas terrae]|uniref:3-oxoacyl-[acyl-carrier protein] reductase n=1 Tax=Silvimonas terrae TaxID=300266 RepID=A0A840RLF4_9NEIS|nr:SDR family oxidoreductase [Silvimonas terrae]MBB5193358.1 3-oxoacyl-[acyl-carrier protein] reductase [Silvimonas terrae]
MPQQKIALVTGASRGIGAAVALRLAQDGFAVVVNYAASATEAHALVDRIQSAGGTAIATQADVANAAQVRQLFDTIEQTLGKLDVLVNNAGVMTVQPLTQTTDELFERMFDINVRGTFNTLREAATRLADGGHVINFSTTALAMNLPGYATYNATKAAVEAYTRVFAKELRGRKITVNAIAPGPVATELFLKGKTAEQIGHFASLPPLERLGEPDDIAAVVSMLVGTNAGWVNGQVLRANGGVA